MTPPPNLAVAAQDMYDALVALRTFIKSFDDDPDPDLVIRGRNFVDIALAGRFEAIDAAIAKAEGAAS